MKRAYMIAECVGSSIYEAHTIPFVYLKREWAEHQKKILEQDLEEPLTLVIRVVQIVESGPYE